MDVRIRDATAAEAMVIPALMRGERVNPTGLHWRRFLVAEAEGALVGCVQLRPAGPGAVELGSLVVRPDLRGRGIGRRLVAAAVARAGAQRVLVVTAAAREPGWARWGFRRIPLGAAPGRVRLNLIVGQAGSLIALARRLRPRRLAILERVATPAGPGPA